MSKLKVAIMSPVDDNVYSLLVTQMCINEPGILVECVICQKKWSFIRIINEYKKSKALLIKKLLRKYCESEMSENSSIESLIINKKLTVNSLYDLTSAYNIPYKKIINPNDLAARSFLTTHVPDIIVSIGSVILKKSFLEIPDIGVLNVHMGILPEYRGNGVTEWPIIEGKFYEIGLGVTLHLLEPGVDTGPIIIKKNIKINKGDNLDKVESKYLPEMVELMIQGIRMARDNVLKSTLQGRGLGKQYFVTHERIKLIAKLKVIKIADSGMDNII